jgi:hypothetical protein
MTTNSLAVKPGILSKLQIKETVLILAVSIVIPFLVHLLPAYNGAPAGAIVLAMFFAPYYAIKYFKFHVGVIAALFAPMLNYLVTGQPAAGLIPLLTLQLVLFVFVSKILYGVKAFQYLNAFFAYGASIIVSAILLLVFSGVMPGMTTGGYFESAFITGFPGILLLILANATLIQFDRK